MPFSITWQIIVYNFSNRQDSTPWTTTDVVNRLLTAGVTRRIGLDAQRYVFDSEQATKYAKVLAPEFAFTRGTLFEALLTVGGYIHAIPRLVDENRSDGALTVKFDLLGQDDVYSGTLPVPIYERYSWSGNEYCGALDSTVDNLLNTTDRTQGAVTEPSADTFRAVNTTDGGFRISANDGLVILTDKPIYQVTKLEFYLAIGTDPSESGYRRESIDINRHHAVCVRKCGVSNAVWIYGTDLSVLKRLGARIHAGAEEHTRLDLCAQRHFHRHF